MSLSPVSAYHLNSKLYEPSRNNCFEFIVNDDLNKLLFAGKNVETDTAESDYLTGIQDTLRLSLQTASVPQFKIGFIEVKRGNSQVKYADIPTFESGTLKFHDFVGARTKDALMAWQALAYNVVDDVVNLATKYKFDCTLIEYNPDMSEILRQWTLVGCWISDITEEDFDHESHDKRTITAEIQYDRAVPIINI